MQSIIGVLSTPTEQKRKKNYRKRELWGEEVKIRENTGRFSFHLQFIVSEMNAASSAAGKLT